MQLFEQFRGIAALGKVFECRSGVRFGQFMDLRRPFVKSSFHVADRCDWQTVRFAH